jgi:hypothetical protein
MQDRGVALQLRAPSREARQIVGATWSNSSIRIAAGIHRKQNEIHVDLTLDGPLAKQRFGHLKEQQMTIQRAIGSRDGKWYWEKREGIESHIILRRLAYPEEDRAWQDQHTWLSDTIFEFHRAFAPLILAMLEKEAKPSTNSAANSGSRIRS